MIFTELSLTNFGLFSGKQVFDLMPRTENDNYRPIILFGGKNGAGKTTILEAIRLCLYGREALGSRVEKAEYDHYLLQKIHRRPGKGDQPSQARITLKFEHAHQGTRDLYLVERSWRRLPSGSAAEENLLIKCNDRYLSGIDIAIWPEFIKDLIPPGVSQLFFFDGEKIQELAEDETGSNALSEAIKITFGLNLVEYLKTDLNVYTRKELDSKSKQEHLERRTLHQQEMEDLQARLNIARQQFQDADVEFIRLDNQLKKTKSDLDREGGLFAERRNDADASRKLLEGQIALVSKRIQTQLAEDLLPFAAVPGLLQELKQQLVKEEIYQRWQASRELLKQHNAGLLQKLSAPLFWQDLPGATPEVISNLTTRLQQEINISGDIPPEFESFNLVHGLSQADSNQVLQLIDRSLTSTPGEISAAFDELETLTAQYKEAKLQFDLAPGEEVLQPLANKHLRLLELKVVQSQERDRRAANVESLLRESKLIENKILFVEQEMRKQAGHNDRLEIAEKVKKVVDSFYQQLMESRISDLELALVRYFGQLSRKRKLIYRAQINRENFQVTLFTRDGQQLSKSSLSAGEKQIYAIALLWALRDISGRPLPVIIDTPLGRLDSDHRQHIVENYLPFASHQVVILSTDTEIDQAYFAALEGAISHSYHLQYDNEEMRTIVDEGYFWHSQPQPDLRPTVLVEERVLYEA